MIFVDNQEVSELQFSTLLAKGREILLPRLRNSAMPLPLDFEKDVYDALVTASMGSPFEGHVVKDGKHAFPDIVAKKLFGAEVKMTIGDKWASTGNSVLETTRVGGVERIYIFFGKLGGVPDIKYRSYSECMQEVGVTHSPRYKINMLLEPGQTIFDKIGVSYDEVRNDQNPIKRFKDYYRKNLGPDEELWWIDQDLSDGTVSPVIKPYRTLSPGDKERFIAECMILFPEIFSNKQSKYERVAAYLITHYNVVSSNVRDIFTAGGHVYVDVMGRQVELPQIIGSLKTRMTKIKDILQNIDEEILKDYWRVDSVPANREAFWRELLLNSCGWKENELNILSVI